MDLFNPGAISDFFKVISIDLMLAGDNIVVMGALAAGLEPDQRRKVLAIGVGLALVCLIGFAFIATTLLKITGVLLAGGLLLLWVAWKLYRELTHKDQAPGDLTKDVASPKSFRKAVVQMAIADISMSLDNVLAVAGAARNHPQVLFLGLGLSVLLMGIAANAIARIIERHRWIAFGGLIVIVYVSGGMILEGWADLHPVVTKALLG